MCECKLTVLSWHCFLTWHRFCISIDIPVCSNHLTRLWAITREQPNILAACIALRTAATCQKPSYAHFDIHIALVQYTSCRLFFDFHFSVTKDSRIVCLHIQNNVMVIFQTYFFSTLFMNTWSSLKFFCMVVLSDVWPLYTHAF